VAALASIQVAVPSRKVIVSGLIQQQGGGHSDVQQWLAQKQYISATDLSKPAGTPIEITIRIPTIQAKKIHFYLTLQPSTGKLTEGTITVRGTPPGEPEMPRGALRIQFLNPVNIPSPTPQSVLPIRLLDVAGMPWYAGILYENILRSFHSDPTKTLDKQNIDFTMLLEALFRKTQGYPADLPKRAELQTANNTFLLLQNSDSIDPLVNALRDFLYTYAKWQPGLAAPGYPPGAPIPGYAPPPPGYGGYPYGAPPPPVAAGLPLAAPTTSLLRAGPLAPLQQMQYTIPQSASKTLLETLKSFRQQLALENSPAAMRAQALAGVVLPNRDVQTNVCNDPFWTLPNLSRVYPWATLQFLCVKDWATLTGDRSKVEFAPQWDTFLDGIFGASGVYKSPLRVEKTGKFLDQIKVKDFDKFAVCSSPRVRPKQVKDALLEIQGVYERHVANMWGILNALIVILKDPETKTEFVRLHPGVTAGASSKAYIDEVANKARDLIATFYVEIESKYVTAIGRLQSV
jgi:hypothetical protein